MFELIISLTKIESESDREFLENLFTRYEKALKKSAMEITDNDSDAEDCVIETFVRISDYLDKYKEADEEYRKNLLFYSCKNIARNIRKRENRRLNNETSLHRYDNDDEEYESELVDIDGDIEKIVISNYTQKVIRENLNKIKQHHKEVLVLKYFNNLSNQEIAKILGVSDSVVSMRIMRAKEELLKKGGEELYDLAQR